MLPKLTTGIVGGASPTRVTSPQRMEASSMPFVQLRARSEHSHERAVSDGAGQPVTDMAVIDLRQELEECNEDKESVASETMPQGEAESLIEADMQTTLNENKQALSEGDYSDHEDGKSDPDKVNVVVDAIDNSAGRHCQCETPEQKLFAAKKIRPIEVLKILGEGS